MNLPVLAAATVDLPPSIFAGTGLAKVFKLSHQGDALRSIFEDYQWKIKAIRSLSENLSDEAICAGASYLFTSTERSRSPEPVRANELDYAIKTVDVECWQRAFNLTGAYELMCQEDREAWTKSFTERDVPEFEFLAVADTLDTILKSKDTYFARRVQYVFRSLSNEHKTNPAHAFYKRLIINCSDGFGGITWRGTGVVNDLRSIISMFIRGELTGVAGTTDAIQQIVRDQNYGKWVSFDNGAFRLKVFKKGTIHIEVDEDMAWRLNSVLASLYDLALPERMYRHTSGKSVHPKYYELRQRYLSAECLTLIADLKHSSVREGTNFNYNRRFLKETAQLPFKQNTSAYKELVEVLEACGGIQKGGHFEFDYNFVDTVRFDVLRNQCIPEDKSHQFYATREAEAKEAIEWANISPEHDVLEPSAGTAGIAKHLPGNVTCVEVDSLRASVLESMGYNVINDDFLSWAETAPTFDRIVMNPPFSLGRVDRHIDTALDLLKVNGVLVAIVPTTLKSRLKKDGFHIEWGPEIKDAFEKAAVTVRMMKVIRL